MDHLVCEFLDTMYVFPFAFYLLITNQHMRRDFKVGTSEFSVAVWHKTPLWTTATVIVVVPKIIQTPKG
jgi:hypothetical protein